MVTPELRKYVELSLSKATPELLREKLVSAGWNPADVDECLAQTTRLSPSKGKFITVLLGVAIAAAGGFASFAEYSHVRISRKTSLTNSSSSVLSLASTPSSATSATPIPKPIRGAPSPTIAGWQAYATVLTIPSFTLDYPPGWSVSEEKIGTIHDGIDSFYLEQNLTDPSGPSILVEVFESDQGLARYAKKKDGTFHTGSSTAPFTLNSTTPLTVQGFPAIQTDYSLTLLETSHSLTTDILINGNVDIELGYGTVNNEADFAARKNIMNQVLTSMRFAK